MSQRLRQSRLTCSTQTDELIHNLASNSPKSVRFTSSSASDDMSPCMSLNEDSGLPGEFYEEPSALYERLLKAEEVSLIKAPQEWVLLSITSCGCPVILVFAVF